MAKHCDECGRFVSPPKPPPTSYRPELNRLRTRVRQLEASREMWKIRARAAEMILAGMRRRRRAVVPARVTAGKPW